MKFRVYNRETVRNVGYGSKPTAHVNLQLICDEVDGKPDGTMMSLSFEGDDFKALAIGSVKDLAIGSVFELTLAPGQSKLTVGGDA